MSNTIQPVLTCSHLVRQFKQGSELITVLDSINLTINPGEQIAIVGSSGSGKTTLLHLLAGLDKPTSGEITIQGHVLTNITEKQLCFLRNRYFGFIYQFHHLLLDFTAIENVAMPLLIGKLNKAESLHKATDLLNKVGLQARYHHKISELSGGERQRVAIARALVTQPSCVLADEPTGNLDNRTAAQVYETIQALHRQMNTAFILVTHDYLLAEKMDKIYLLENGRLRIR